MSIGILVDKLYNLNMPRKSKTKTGDLIDLGGRPTILNDTMLKILIDSLQRGCTVKQACALAKTSEQNYYNWVENVPGFLSQMEYAKSYLNDKAKLLVSQAIQDGDLNTAKWHLEKTEYKQVQQNNTQVNIGAPKSILDGFIDWKEDVQTNNNAKEDSKVKEEN
jgi:hypothetical protein